MADSSLDLNINIGANTTELSSKLQLAENQLGQFQSALKKATSVGEINYLTKQIDLLQNSIKNTSEQMNKMGKPTGDATQSLVNLSRVAQDAPYGFIGIANNLNPLLESFQRLQKETGSSTSALKSMVSGLTGPAGIGIALGVISSLFVAFGDEIGDFVSSLFSAGTATKEMKTAIDGIGGEFTGAVEKVNKVAVAFDLFHKGLMSGDTALGIYNKSLGANYGLKNNINEAEKAFKDKTPDYIQAQLQRALADVASKKAAEELLKQQELKLKGPETGFFDILKSSIYGAAAPQAAENMAKNRLNQQLADSQKIIDGYIQIQKEAETAANTIANASGIDINPETTKQLQQEQDKQQQVLRQSNKSIQQIADERLKDQIAVLEAEIAATNKWADNEMKIYNRMLDFWKKYGDVVTSVNAASKTRDLISDQDKRREKADKTPFSERKIEIPDYIKTEDNRIKKFDSDLKESIESTRKFASVIAQDLAGAFMTMFDAMQQGENPLQALGDYFTNLAKQIAAAAIQAAIFQAILMAFGGGGASFGEGFTGIFKGLLGMAEGGIVTRPTIAMVGEGGQSEAVMPLNKLGNMMNSTFAAGAMSGTSSGGNGQFVLKGNDLILAINRSNASLNLRRGF